MSPFNFASCLMAFWETLYMVLLASSFATAVGLPLAMLLFLTKPNSLQTNTLIYQSISGLVNAMRSIPFVILMIILLPLTRILVGTSIGPVAATVPLAICAVPFIAKIFQNTLEEIPRGLIESGIAMGASTSQIMLRIVLPESLPGLINGITVTAVTLVGYAVMAGAIIGGGLGELAINYGYQRFNWQIMMITVVLLIILVQCLQMIGDFLARRI